MTEAHKYLLALAIQAAYAQTQILGSIIVAVDE